MKRLETLVQNLERADHLKRKALARELAVHALPESLRNRANAVLPVHLHMAQKLPTGVAETWLLLAKADGEGLVARMGVRSAPRALEPATLRAARTALLTIVGRMCRSLPSEARDYASLYVQDDLDATVTGRSAELAAAITLASLAVRMPALPNVAGTAQLAPDGKLEPVQHLREKVEALRREWPQVTKVVVAKGQVVDSELALEVIHANDLAEALDAFGLDLRALPPCDLDDHVNRVSTLKGEGEKHDADFARLARNAWESGSVLLESQPHLAAKAFGYNALFLLHLGETFEAMTMQRAIDRAELEGEPEILAMIDTFAASAAIDSGDIAQARRLAQGAMDRLGEPRSREHGAMVASARGTYGRTFLHAGEYAEAIVHLSKAAELHHTYAPFEVPRSRGYLATAQRLDGKLIDARRTLELALEQNRRESANRSASRQTTPFLQLEAGRLALAEGNLDEAETRLISVGAEPSRYPDLGALRTRVALALRQGDTANARAIAATCATTVGAQRVGSALAQVGAVGFAELVVAGVATPEESEHALSLLSRAFGQSVAVEDIRGLVEKQVF